MKYIYCGNRFFRSLGGLLLLILLSLVVLPKGQASLFERHATFLSADQAFVFSANNLTDNKLALHWDIAQGYYLYQKEIQIVAENATIATISLPQGESYEDEFFGKVIIYRQNLDIAIPVLNLQSQPKLQITYQGCTTGFCYPPETKTLDLNLWFKPVENTATLAEAPVAKKTTAEETATEKRAVENHKIFDSNKLSSPPTSLSQQFSDQLAKSKYAIIGFFLLGLGLAFTPCVLPMLPLLSAIVIGQQRGSGVQSSPWRALGLSVVYVQGMALTYSLLGLLVVAIGLPLQIALQSPYVLIGFSLLFVLLALSMFGLFELSLPQSWQNKLIQLSQRQKTGAYAGVFAMGMLAGLIASPCTTAPLSGALLYVAQSGDWLRGGLTLYVLALGMGLPLILVTLFGNKILPKSGAWLETVKGTFGFVLLSLPILLLSRILPEIWEIRLWALLATSFFIWLASQFKAQGITRFVSSCCLIFALIAVKPLQDWLWQTPTEQATPAPLPFEKVNSYSQLQQILTNNHQEIVMLDLYANWCVACKEFEKYTFADPQVQQAFAHMRLLRIDMSHNSAENKELMEKLDILGLPTIIFFDNAGYEITDMRITGFMNADEFLAWLKRKP